MQFLLYTLYAPMASFGAVAVGERRLSWARPGRSAVLGLVAGAQGITRSDAFAHRRLEDGLHYAVRTDVSGRPLVDYHTAQSPKKRKGQSFSTRRDELESADLHTVLSSREWYIDACFTVALWPRLEQAIDLTEIAKALQKPHFVLYLGRKSAPLGLPLNPEIVVADTFVSAFGAREFNDSELSVLDRIGFDKAAQHPIAFDRDVPELPSRFRTERRRDRVVDRGRWQFEDRLEGVTFDDTSDL